MTRALFAKAVRDGRLLLVCLAVLLFAFTWLQVWATSLISLPALSEFLTNAVPKRLERLSGLSFSKITTPEGRISLVFVHPVTLFSTLAWAIARGSDCVSGEISRGTMELLLAQPVKRSAIYWTQAIVTILGSAILAAAVWGGLVAGLATVSLDEPVAASLFVPPAINLFAQTACLAAVAALFSSFDSQRWRTVGLMGGFFALSMVLLIASRASEKTGWLACLSILTPYKPQTMVAEPAEAWSLLAHENGAVVGLGSGACQLVFLVVGLGCYAIGAMIFNRRELPAPL